jgi:hypothetical protein
VLKTYAPRGQTPVLWVPLSRDHLSVISGITAHGWLHTRVQDRPFRGGDAARFLRYLATHISVRLLVIWDSSPIHRCQEVKAFLASPAGQGAHLERLPAYTPELNPDEGVWNYLGQLSYSWGRPSSGSGRSLTSSGPASLRLGWFNSLLKDQYYECVI